MRISKEPEERRNEILDTAEMLFFTKGYARTTVNDVLQVIGIAKGTFYYYFKSKEEVMDAVVVRFIDAGVAAARGLHLIQSFQFMKSYFTSLWHKSRIRIEKDR